MTVYRKPLTGRGAPKPTSLNGRRFPSKAQAKRADELEMLKRAGQVAWVLYEVPIDIGEPGVDKPYRVDFVVAEFGQTKELGSWQEVGMKFVWLEPVFIHAEDVKGFDTPSFNRHVKQWRLRGPFPLHIIRSGDVQVIKGGSNEQAESSDR